MGHPATARVAALAALAAVALPGCGELGASFRGTRSDPPRALAQADVDRQPAGSPARTILAWCRTLQRADVAAAKRLYGRRRRAAAIREDVLGGIFTFRVAGCPAVQEVAVRGDRATVFTELSTRRVAPNGRVDASVRPQAFNVERAGGRWAVRPGNFLSRAVFGPARPLDELRRPRLVRTADLRRYPAGSPERGALELLRLLQYDDPVAALPRFGDGFGLTLTELAEQLGNLGDVARSWAVPPALRVDRRADVATIDTSLGRQRSTVVLRRHAGVWQLRRYRLGDVIGPR